MNHTLWNRVASRVLALTFVVAGLAACGESISNVTARTPKATPPDASAVVIGTAPGQPMGDPPGTTSVASTSTEMTKGAESAAMPLPGQPNDHSNPGDEGSQKAEQKDGALKTGESAKSSGTQP